MNTLLILNIGIKIKKNLFQEQILLKLKNFQNFITSIKNQLVKQYKITNEGLEKNKHIKLGRDGRPIVKTPKLESTESNGCVEILGKDQYLPLINILSDIKNSTDFSEAFTHYSRKTIKKQLPNELLFAALIGLGCNIGVRKMGKISKGIGANKLDYTVRWYFSKENLDEANRRILYLTNCLSLPKVFNKKKRAIAYI